MTHSKKDEAYGTFMTQLSIMRDWFEEELDRIEIEDDLTEDLFAYTANIIDDLLLLEEVIEKMERREAREDLDVEQALEDLDVE